jgi:hypothetical protein
MSRMNAINTGLFCFAALFALPTCMPSTATPVEVEVEGDDAGECSDGADNDLDGYFDCDDNGCWGSPDCETSTTGTTSTTSTTSTTGTTGTTGTTSTTITNTGPVAIAGHLKEFSLTYSLTMDFGKAAGIDLCDLYDICDCVSEYTAASTEQHEAEEDRVTFVGSWGMTSSDCADGLDSVWWDNATGEAYASFIFEEDMSQLISWFQHDSPNDWEPWEDAFDHEQWYITDMYEDFDGESSHYEEVESTLVDGLIPLDLTHVFDVTFAE